MFRKSLNYEFKNTKKGIKIEITDRGFFKVLIELDPSSAEYQSMSPHLIDIYNSYFRSLNGVSDFADNRLTLLNGEEHSFGHLKQLEMIISSVKSGIKMGWLERDDILVKPESVIIYNNLLVSGLIERDEDLSRMAEKDGKAVEAALKVLAKILTPLRCFSDVKSDFLLLISEEVGKTSSSSRL